MPTAPASSKGPFVYVFGEPILRQIAQPVDTSLSIIAIQAQADKLANAIYGGGALSAPQAGFSSRMFIIADNQINDKTFVSVKNTAAIIPNQTYSYQLFINPVLSNMSTGTNTWVCSSEGCMSFLGYNDGWDDDSGIYEVVNTTRSNTFTINYQTIECPPGGSAALVSKSFSSNYNNSPDLNWMIQHEVDHLNGKLFIDYEPTTNLNNIAFLASIVAGTCASDWPIEYPGNS